MRADAGEPGQFLDLEVAALDELRVLGGQIQRGDGDAFLQQQRPEGLAGARVAVVQRVLEAVYVYRLRLRGVQKPPVHDIHIAMARK